MKTTLAVFALSLLPIASPALAFASSAGTEAGRYFQSDSAISFGALVLAAAVMMAANVGERRKQTRLATANAAHPAWRQEVMKDLEAELQLFSRQLRRAA